MTGKKINLTLQYSPLTRSQLDLASDSPQVTRQYPNPVGKPHAWQHYLCQHADAHLDLIWEADKIIRNTGLCYFPNIK